MNIRTMFKNRRKGPAKLPCLPQGVAVYAVGDIHGRLDLFDQLTAAIEADIAAERPPHPVLILLGDYVDRGPDSFGVIERLIDYAPEGIELVQLRGNHEQALMDFLAGDPIADVWLRFGGWQCLESYGVRLNDDAPIETIRAAWRAIFPAHHLAFLRRLRFSHEIGDYGFVHAGIRPGIPWAAQATEDLLWIREPFLSSKADFGKMIVHGHSITEKADFRANRIGIDTGAFQSGRLTCLKLVGETQTLLQTGAAVRA